MRIIEPRAFKLRSTSAAILMVLALGANPARAQLAVSDSPVEANTTIIASTLSGISSQQVPAIIAQDTLTAQSLTTPGGAGRFQSQLSYLNSLMQTMGSGVASAQTFAATYPGWVDFGANAAATEVLYFWAGRMPPGVVPTEYIDADHIMAAFRLFRAALKRDSGQTSAGVAR